MTLDLYYSANYQRLYYKEYNQTMWMCPCGSYVSRGHKNAHKRSKRHKRLMEKIEIPKPNLLVKFD